MMRSSTLARSENKPVVLACALVAALASACQEDGKTSQKQAAELCAKLAPVVAEDVGQVRTGLPAGSQKLATLIDTDPGANLLGLQRAIAGARASVKELEFAKSTFFSFADPSGTVLRSEADPDMLANRSVLASFPDLRKVLAPGSGLVEAFGEMQEMRGVRNGPDLQWVAVHPVKASDGELKGLFVTGWSFRAYAYRLQEAAKRDIAEIAKRDGLKSTPLLYVFAWKGAKAYGGPVTPDVNTEALEKLDLPSKTASGPWSGTVEIAGRTFGAAAQRTPELAADAGVAALVSTL
ncbi:hypothetical protein BE21_31760 [Sorangium cellulosum]|uniref:Secreted protein n=1 Tax=Sorangium cellulosum TaxID=56 RepID=A0A150TQL6_SORCE|nr:hypothetical protein BE21_31760 [Sorangium cellulosum]